MSKVSRTRSGGKLLIPDHVACGDNLAKSAATMSQIMSSRLMVGCQPRICRARDASSRRAAIRQGMGSRLNGLRFKRIALGLGLVGPMRATTPGEAFLAAVAPILAAAGPLPPCPPRHRRADDRAQEAGGEGARVRVPCMRLHRLDRAQVAGDGRRAALPNPRSRRDASRTARRGRGGRGVSARGGALPFCLLPR